MSRERYIVDKFTEIVTATATRYDGDVYYQYGHPLEIIATLQELSRTTAGQALKFPLIALFLDFDEQKGEQEAVESVVKLHFIIATLTRPEYKAAQRYTENFKAVLYPIYDAFLIEIAASGYFKERFVMDLKHTKTDRLYWGKNGLYGNAANTFNDFIDAIEIQNLQLNVKEIPCEIPGLLKTN